MSSRLGNGKLRKDQTDPYGRLKRGGGGGASVDDFVDTSTIIVSEDVTSGKIRMDVAADVTAKIDNSLQTPITAPTSTELVGIGTDKSQERIIIGDGLNIENNTLEVTSSSNTIEIQLEDITPNNTYFKAYSVKESDKSKLLDIYNNKKINCVFKIVDDTYVTFLKPIDLKFDDGVFDGSCIYGEPSYNFHLLFEFNITDSDIEETIIAIPNIIVNCYGPNVVENPDIIKEMYSLGVNKIITSIDISYRTSSLSTKKQIIPLYLNEVDNFYEGSLVKVLEDTSGKQIFAEYYIISYDESEDEVYFEHQSNL